MPLPRVILLGASNLVREPWLVIDTARRVLGSRELEVLGAYGHGRSYGMRSRFALRSLPGIRDCGLWRALDGLPAAETYALVTDIGNDIGYGVDAETIASWVEDCVGRLEKYGARIVMTAVPLVSLDRFADWQIGMARRIFFPLADLSVGRIRRRVAELDRRLREIPDRHDAALAEPETDWYGIDPIHLRRGRVPAAFARILGAWTGSPPEELARPSARSWLRLRAMLPESWRWLGMELGRRQPACTLPGPIRVSLY